MKKTLIPVAAVLACMVSAGADAALLTFTAPLAAEGNNSPATGSTTVTFDENVLTLRVQASFSGLLGNTTASHIHCCTTLPFTGNAGVATQLPTFSDFPLGVRAGTYDRTFDLTLASSWNPAFVTASGGTTAAATARLVGAFGEGRTYLNIHTNVFPGGEIRGVLVPAPEPASVGLLGLGLASLAFRRRRRS